MAIGPISSSPVPGAYDAARAAGESTEKTAVAAQQTIADHVAAADEHEPVRSFSSTVGTLVDTYL